MRNIPETPQDLNEWQNDVNVRSYNDGYFAGQKSVVDHKISIELRDRFAMAALNGILSQQTRAYYDNKTAEVCFEIADAMIKARNHYVEPIETAQPKFDCQDENSEIEAKP